MKKLNKSLALVLGSALAASGAISANATENNPFSMTSISSSIDLAMSGKGQDGKCGEGKCGKNKKKKDGKCGEGKCGKNKKKKDGKCGEGKCGSDK